MTPVTVIPEKAGIQQLNPDFPLEKKAVIPAKAGIQLIEKCLRSRSTLVPCPLRGNDGSNGKSGLNISRAADQAAILSRFAGIIQSSGYPPSRV
jgi:hypothetical protein